MYAVVNTFDDANTVQKDLSKIDNWSDIWQIRFNSSAKPLVRYCHFGVSPVNYSYSDSDSDKKCNHMHLGKEQQLSTYFMSQNGEPTKINQVSEQKHLGGIIDNKQKFIPHIQAMVKRQIGI